LRLLKNVMVLIVFICFVFTVRLMTKGYLINPPEIIDEKQLQLIIEDWQESGYYQTEEDKKVFINDIFNHLLTQQAIIEEANRRNITVTNEEVKEQISFLVQLYEEDDINPADLGIDLSEYESMEEYFWNEGYENIKHNLLVEKFYMELSEENINNVDSIIEKIRVEFYEENKKHIDRLRAKYGIDDMEMSQA
jgi:hypothetical protein